MLSPRSINPLSLGPAFYQRGKWKQIVSSCLQHELRSLPSGWATFCMCCWSEKIVVTPVVKCAEWTPVFSWGPRVKIRKTNGDLCVWTTQAVVLLGEWRFLPPSWLSANASQLTSLLYCTMAELMVPTLLHGALLRLNWGIFLTHYQEH